MSTIAVVACNFLLFLSLGTSLFSWIAEPRDTGAGFIRLIAGHGFFMVLAMQVVMWLAGGAEGQVWFSGLLALTIGLQWRLHPDRRTPLMWGLFGIQVVAAAYWIVTDSKHDTSLVFFYLSSMLFVGVTQYAMLLGHYYLVVPKLSEKPLLTSLRCLWVIMGIKLLFSAKATWDASPYLMEGTELGGGFAFNWLMVSMRWLWGYAAMGILSYFAWRLCRMRSIQSATGVLYVMVFFVFVGELLSLYLSARYNLNL